MVYSIDIHERERSDPVWRGLFYAGDVVRLLSATDDAIRGERKEIGGRAVQGWSRRGFFKTEKNEFDKNRAFVSFGGVITSRVIALLKSYGTRIGRIEVAHTYLQEATGQEFPFASRKFWIESAGLSKEVHSELDELVVTSSKFGQLPFTDLLYGLIEYPDDMEFDDSEDEFAVKWEPSPGIVIDPDVQSGASCLKGTRTPTHAIYGGYVAGDDVAGLADGYRLNESQVRRAIDWEARLVVV